MNVTQIKDQIMAIDPAFKFGNMNKKALETELLMLSARESGSGPALDKDGNMFKTDFDMSAAFSWNQMQDEQHAPSDLLTNYPEPFQLEIAKLRKVTDIQTMKDFGKWAFDHIKPAVNGKAWNYWCIEYRMKQHELTPPITEHGNIVLTNSVAKLNACPNYNDVKALGAYWYNLQETGKLVDEYGLNSTEIDALWKEYAKVKSSWESMTNGLGFTGSPF